MEARNEDGLDAIERFSLVLTVQFPGLLLEAVKLRGLPSELMSLHRTTDKDTELKGLMLSLYTP